VYPKGANSMVASGLVSRSDLVGTGRAISILFGIMELETTISPCTSSVSSVQGRFF